MPTYAPPRSLPLRPEGRGLRVEQAASTVHDRTGLLLGLVLLLASTAFALHLGHSSLFIDEVYSWQASKGNMRSLLHAVQYNEVAPPLYYLILHGWMQLAGSDGELVLRLPSALAGVALVASVYWLGGLVAGRPAGLVAATLAAVSPLVLLYAQQVRAYVWVMLALTIAVAAVLQATRDRSLRWLIVAGVAAICSMLLHYTALLVLAPLVVWLWCRSEIDVRWRLGFGAAIALPLVALVPLALQQTSQGHQDTAATYASLTMLNALRIAGSPFDGRATGGFVIARELGAVIVVEALALLALGERFRGVHARRLIAACGAVPLAAILVAGALQQPVALTRYTAVAVPFILVAIAAVAVRLQRPLAALLLTCTLVVSGLGMFAAQLASGQNPDTRAAIERVAHDWRKGDAVVSLGQLGFDGALGYYADRLLPRGARRISAFRTLAGAGDAPAVIQTAFDRGRVWAVSDPVMSPRELRDGFGRVNLRPVYVHTFNGNAKIQLVRAEPSR